MNKYENYTIDEMLTAIEGSYDVANEGEYNKEAAIGAAIGALITTPLMIPVQGAVLGAAVAKTIKTHSDFEKDLEDKSGNSNEGKELVAKYFKQYNENLQALSMASGKVIKLTKAFDKTDKETILKSYNEIKNSYGEIVNKQENILGFGNFKTKEATYKKNVVGMHLIKDAIMSDPKMMKELEKSANGLKTVYVQANKAIEEVNAKIKSEASSNKADKEKLKALSACAKALRKMYNKALASYNSLLPKKKG